MKGDLDKALADLSTAIQLAPTGGRSYFNRGFAYFQKGEYDKAIADYSEAIGYSPTMPKPTATGAMSTRSRAIWSRPWQTWILPCG